MFFYDWTYLLIIPGLLLGIWAQMKVKSAYAEYSRIPTRLGMNAAYVVDQLLRRNGNNKVRIGRVKGELTDHYNPADETLNLSEGVWAVRPLRRWASRPMRPVTPCRSTRTMRR